MRNVAITCFILMAYCTASANQPEKFDSAEQNNLPAGMANEHFRKNNGQWNKFTSYDFSDCINF